MSRPFSTLSASTCYFYTLYTLCIDRRFCERLRAISRARSIRKLQRTRAAACPFPEPSCTERRPEQRAGTRDSPVGFQASPVRDPQHDKVHTPTNMDGTVCVAWVVVSVGRGYRRSFFHGARGAGTPMTMTGDGSNDGVCVFGRTAEVVCAWVFLGGL